jgi:hypothetical protein
MRTISAHLSAALAALLFASAALGQASFTTVYTLQDAYPVGLTFAKGVFYGGTNYSSNCGTVFELQPPASLGGRWVLTTLYAFASTGGDACVPYTPSVAPGGALYGAAYGGGPYLGGAVYELRPPASSGGAWTEGLIYSFTGLGQPGGDGGFPYGLTPSSAGSLYIPACCGGLDDDGSVFELTPPGGARRALDRDGAL